MTEPRASVKDTLPSEVTVEEFRRADVLDLKYWGKHCDLRFSHYDFSKFVEDSIFDTWYDIKTRGGKKLFAVKRNASVRGFISLRDHNILTSSYVMGIVIDPAFVSKGLGQIALKKFLKIYFEEMKNKLLKLKVSDFNHRAKRVYEKCGFKYIKTAWEPFENQLISFRLISEFDDFKMVGDEIFTSVSSYNMNITRYNELKIQGLMDTE